ncbi:hypothetical protein [Sphingomonas paucimobilis]|uniref:DUF4398 domain-containing protein n=1 Tax=Sphingomonas paucimobilis TaxID=13689 RepID=A0A7T3ABY0_SPHPI|nr:hypothetical protein [Sphingomonas paucimobilis]QPT09859.1 hypothetical protein I6G38_06355 [Sphingomonas paucimobilis]
MHTLFPIIICALTLLAGCAPMPALRAVPGPAVVADRTVLDERAAIAIEASWRVAGRAIERAVDRGDLVGEQAARAERLDAAAGIWVARARAAYDTVNAASMADAIARAKPLIAEMRSLVGVRP